MRAASPQGWWWSTWRDPPCNIFCCAPTRIGIFPKGLVEAGRAAPGCGAARSARGNDAGESGVRLGQGFMDTGPYNKGKISRYYLARSNDTEVHLPINPELGFPEHQEARWVGFETALTMVSPRLLPVIHWASEIIAAPAAAPGAKPLSSKSNGAPADFEHVAADENLRSRGSRREIAWKAGLRIRPAKSAAEPAARAASSDTRRRSWRWPSRWRDLREWRRRPERRNAPTPDRGRSRPPAICAAQAENVGHAVAVFAADLGHRCSAKAPRGAPLRSR